MGHSAQSYNTCKVLNTAPSVSVFPIFLLVHLLDTYYVAGIILSIVGLNPHNNSVRRFNRIVDAHIIHDERSVGTFSGFPSVIYF